MAVTQVETAEAFRALHSGPDSLVLANVADVVSAKIVAAAGYPAIATSSAGIAWLLGYPDGEHISRADMLGMVGRIVRAVDLPVTADMEAGYGEQPEDVARTVLDTIAAGAVGLNIEDGATQRRDPPLLDVELSVARIEAARAAAAEAGVPVVINARTDVFLRGGSGTAAFEEAVLRANAYRAAGADCLFVPGVRDAETIGKLVVAIDGPVNILASAASPSVPELKALGVARVSIGGLLTAASAALVRHAAEELKATGTYGFAADVIPHPELNALLR